MKHKFPGLASISILTSFLLSGCSDNPHSSHAAGAAGDSTPPISTPAQSPAPAPASPPAPTASEGGSVVITGNDLMRFAPTEFTVQAGSEVKVVFKNIGKMPKQAMGHNLVILTRGVAPATFAQAAMRHPKEDYLPPDYADRIIAATRLLGPGEEETLTFTAPSEPGDYAFVCSFPGHTPAGMRGTMRVIVAGPGA